MKSSPAFIEFDEDQDQELNVQFHKVGIQQVKKQENDKYTSAKMQKNFFETNTAEDWFKNYQQLEKDNNQKTQFLTPIANRKRRMDKKLAPLSYQPKVQEAFSHRTKVKKQEQNEESQENQQIQIDFQKPEVVEQLKHKFLEETSEIVPQKIQLNTIRRKKKRQQLAKKQSSSDKEQQQQQVNQIHKEVAENKKQNQSQQQSASQQVQNKNKKPQTMIVDVNKFLLNSLPQDRIVRLTILRASSFIGYSHEYDVAFTFDNRYLLSAKKVSNSHLVTINFSTKKNDYQENGPFYMGKIKGNFMGTVFNIFSPGFSPENAVKLSKPRRQLLATVIYQNEIFGGNKPRSFKAYVKNPDINYLHLAGVEKNNQPGLDQLFNIFENKQRIACYRNRKPVWKEELQGYSLNFRGRVNQPSIKNFIMEIDDANNVQQTQQALLFGRASDNQFNLDVSNPLSPMVGIGIALTSFYTT